jgi:plastocyanin
VSVRALLLAASVLAWLPAGAAAAPLPGSGSFTAKDFEWDAAGGGHTVIVAQGATVAFAYPSGRSEHNAHFLTGQPSSCVQSAGDSSGPVPPLPRVPTGAGWSGSCTFNQPGRYMFHCDIHPFMTGVVAVQASGTSATSSPLAGSPGRAVRIAARQRGSVVRGTIRIGRAGQGGSLQARLLAGRTLAGRTTVDRLRPGSLKLALKLNRAGLARLARTGRLSLQVRLVARTPAGRAVSVTRRVLLRR